MATPPKKSAAARSETDTKAEPKSVTFQGLKLELPDVLPSVMLFDLTEIEATSDSNPMPIYRLLRAVLGASQFTQARHRVPADDDGSAAVELLDEILGKYGLSVGE